jgi:hypothetical protein
VLVGGARVSAADIVCDAGRSGTAAFLSVRRGHRILPRLCSSTRPAPTVSCCPLRTVRAEIQSCQPGRIPVSRLEFGSLATLCYCIGYGASGLIGASGPPPRC